MTVVAFDGKTLAADRMSTCNYIRTSITKLFQIDAETFVACTGDASGAAAMRAWFAAGAAPEKFPACQSTDSWARLIVFRMDKGVEFYERTPHAIPLEDPFYAWGAGAETALGAMAAGADAREAVLIASRFCESCGYGVDMTIDGRCQRGIPDLPVKT